MATAALAQQSKTDLVSRLKSARNSIAKMREGAEKILARATIGALAPVAGYGTGWVHGWAEREGKDIKIGESEFTYMAAGAAVALVAGVAGEGLLGTSVANVMLGVGAGVLSGETALVGVRHGSAPRT